MDSLDMKRLIQDLRRACRMKIIKSTTVNMNCEILKVYPFYLLNNVNFLLHATNDSVCSIR